MPQTTRCKAGHTGNRLLDHFAPADFKSVSGAAARIRLSARQTLLSTDDPVDHVYFPVTAILSLSIDDWPQAKRSIEFASVGNEGLAGIGVLLGVPTSLHQVSCQVPGDCLRLPARTLVRAMARRKAIGVLLRRYIAVSYRTAIQSVLCNALHTAEQRVARWLLATLDRSGSQVPATQDLLATLLGVKRPTVSLVANALQQAGAISYHRGTIDVRDGAILEQAACSCYRIAQAVHAQLIGP